MVTRVDTGASFIMDDHHWIYRCHLEINKYICLRFRKVLSETVKFLTQWVGLRDNLQETMVFPINYKGFPVDCALNQSNDIEIPLFSPLKIVIFHINHHFPMVFPWFFQSIDSWVHLLPGCLGPAAVDQSHAGGHASVEPRSQPDLCWLNWIIANTSIINH